jgi:outer membrane protein TolC
MKNNLNILTFCFLSFVSILNAQDIIPISKADVLNRVKEGNQTIKISKEDFNQARADYRQTNAIFLPNIAVSHTGISTTNPLMAFGSKLNQEILTANDFNPALLNDPDQTQNFATRIEVKQPLINMDGLYQRKAAKSKMDAMTLQTERTSDYLMFEVDKAYMQLQLAYKAVDVLKKALQAAESNKTLADNSFKQGYLQQADVLAVEVRVTEVKNQLQMARSHVENASNYITFLMNDISNAILKPTDSLTINNFDLVAVSQVSTERSDIKAMQLASNAYENMNKADKMTFLPTLNAFGSYELYDDKVFQGDANGYLMGAQLSWTILDGTKRFGKSQKSRAAYEKSKLQYEQYVSQSQLELNKAKRMFMDAENKLQLSKLAMEQSHESLRIRTNRFEEGLEKTSDLLIAETQFAQKQLEYYQTIFEYNYAQAYLQFLTKAE